MDPMDTDDQLSAAELAYLEGRALVDAEASGDERAVEAALRPRTLDEVVGQERVREQLSLMLHAAQRRGRASRPQGSRPLQRSDCRGCRGFHG